MKMKTAIIFLVISLASAKKLAHKSYKPNWNDLDKRPIPEWYDNAKIGIFIHWGVYSVPAFRSEWFWASWMDGNKDVVKYMKDNYPPNFTYQDFGPMFTAEFFDPREWAALFKAAGAKYVVLTSKHHDGYALFPSYRSFGWNSVDVGPKRDIVKELSEAIRSTTDLRFGVYHSLYEWYNRMYLEDKLNNFTTNMYTSSKLWPDLKQLINDYKPSVIWADGNWEAPDLYWKSTDILSWIYSASPIRNEVVVNDRWGIGIPCKHGDFFNCADRYNPGVLQNHKWENAFTIDHQSWGFRKNIKINEVLTIQDIIREVVTTVSCGGNVLINVGPTKEGLIVPIFQERLLSLGNWLKVNGEAIYSTSPWRAQNDTINGNVWYTAKKNSQYIYAVVLSWPKTNVLNLSDISTYIHKGVYHVQMLGYQSNLEWEIADGVTVIQLPRQDLVDSKDAWTLKFTTNSENGLQIPIVTDTRACRTGSDFRFCVPGSRGSRNRVTRFYPVLSEKILFFFYFYCVNATFESLVTYTI